MNVRNTREENSGYFWVGSVEVNLKPENTTRRGRALQRKKRNEPADQPDLRMLNKRK